ncbi:hypothetical protein [Brevundimonas sp.]|uniref:hypothetical protein n=1 Tax=Brevundimonas sp. TaxID=1871086 RepID=UPI003F723F37
MTVTAADLVDRAGNPRASPRTASAPIADLLQVAPEDAVLLPYQQRLLNCTAQVVVYEKSRRIGISWAAAAQATLISAADEKAGGDDCFYIGFEKEMTRGFIDDCAFWAKHYGVAAGEAEEFVFVDSDPTGDKSIQAFRIKFASGFTIVALTSKPRNLRSRQGFVILDEAAFMDDLDEMMAAALALLVWGSRVWVISSHLGVDNPFNQLVEECRAKKKPYALFRTTFSDAIADGLYRRICLKRGIPWTPEGEAEWEAEIRANYGEKGPRELDCVPDQGSGVWLTRSMIEACATAGGPDCLLKLSLPVGWEQRPKDFRESYVNDWLEQHVRPHIERLDKRLRHVFGQDFAMTGDASIIAPGAMQRTGGLVIPFAIEMRRVPYAQQKQILFWVVHRLPRFSGGKLDARGNGQPLAQEAKQEFGASLIEEVMLSNGWYLENMPPLKADFEDQTVAIPRHPDLIDDMRQVELVRGIPKVPDGKRTKGEDGEQRHGDFAPALALCRAASEEDVITYGGYEGIPGRHAAQLAKDASRSQPASLERAFAEDDQETGRGGAW